MQKCSDGRNRSAPRRTPGSARRIRRTSAAPSRERQMSIPTRSAFESRISNFSRLPTTRATSGIAAKVSGSIWAAQPVTTTRAAGRARFARRIAWRVWRTASLVTAQLLTMIRSSSAWASARIASLSAALSRQPSVITSVPLTIISPSKTAPRAEHPDRRPAPVHGEVPPGRRTGPGPTPPAAAGRDRGREARFRSPGEAGAALPRAADRASSIGT